MYIQKELMMKHKIVSMFVLAVLIITTLFSSAGASGPVELNVNVRNATGAVVSLRLTDANGINTFFSLEPGVYPITLTEGEYSYYASLPCGNLAGSWNVNVVKTLYLSCQHDVAFVSMKKVINGCQYFGSWDEDFDYLYYGGNNYVEPDFLIGPGAAIYGYSSLMCLDPFLSELYSWQNWQIQYVDEFDHWTIIEEDPDYDGGH
jgi:hypothetical protein